MWIRPLIGLKVKTQKLGFKMPIRGATVKAQPLSAFHKKL